MTYMDYLVGFILGVLMAGVYVYLWRSGYDTLELKENAMIKKVNQTLCVHDWVVDDSFDVMAEGAIPTFRCTKCGKVEGL